MMMRMIRSIFTSQGPTGLARAWLFLAGEGVGDLVHGVFRGTLGVVGATFVLQAAVSGHRAGGFLGATFCLSGLCRSLPRFGVGTDHAADSLVSARVGR